MTLSAERIVNELRGGLVRSSRALGVRHARRRSLRPGVTVITANFNTLDYLKACVAGVRRHSPPDVSFLVVDNASRDGSRRWAADRPDVRMLRLPLNIGHGQALDVGVLWACRTEQFVVLDVDAFPISDDWLPRLLEPLSNGAEVAGATSVNGSDPPYVHACCVAMRTERFIERRHTFAPGDSWDTAQRISQLEWPKVHTIPLTSIHSAGILGSVFGGIVYHNFYSARFSVSTRERIDDVHRGQPETAWRDAMDRYFPTGI